jgi:hypothetical protein
VTLFEAYRRFYGQVDDARAHSFLEERVARQESVVFVARVQGAALLRAAVDYGVAQDAHSPTEEEVPARRSRPYCTDTTRSSRDRGADGKAITYAAIFARACRSNGSRKRSSITPKTGIAKLKGSNAKNPNASVAGSSQLGLFGWRNATHRSRRSLPVSRQSLKILRMPPSIVASRVGPR